MMLVVVMRRGGLFGTSAFAIGVLKMRHLVGMGGILLRQLFVGGVVRGMVFTMLVMFFVMFYRDVLFGDIRASQRHRGGRWLDCRGGLGLGLGSGRLMHRVAVIVMMFMVVMIMRLVVMILMTMGLMRRVIVVMIFVLMTFKIMMLRIGVMLGIVRMVMVFVGLRRLGGVDACVFDHLALDAIAIAAAPRVAVARAAAVVGAVFAFLFGFAMGAFVGFDQRLAIGHRNLVIVGMDFAEGEEAMAVAAIFNEGGLKRRFYAGDLGKVDIAAQLLALGGLEVKFFDAIAADHDNPGLFRVGGID
jgi:hypothetical protein